jgi:hypothetical protein
MHIHIFIYTYTYIFTYIHIHIHIHIYIYIYIHIYAYTYLHIHIIYIYTYTYLRIYLFTYLHLHIHMYIYIYMYKYIYTLPSRIKKRIKALYSQALRWIKMQTNKPCFRPTKSYMMQNASGILPLPFNLFMWTRFVSWLFQMHHFHQRNNLIPTQAWR